MRETPKRKIVKPEAEALRMKDAGSKYRKSKTESENSKQPAPKGDDVKSMCAMS